MIPASTTQETAGTRRHGMFFQPRDRLIFTVDSRDDNDMIPATITTTIGTTNPLLQEEDDTIIASSPPADDTRAHVVTALEAKGINTAPNLMDCLSMEQLTEMLDMVQCYDDNHDVDTVASSTRNLACFGTPIGMMELSSSGFSPPLEACQCTTVACQPFACFY